MNELLEGGELNERILASGKISENIAAEYMKQILAGVAYCHKNDIIN